MLVGLFIISHYLWWLCSVSCSGLLLMVVINSGLFMVVIFYDYAGCGHNIYCFYVLQLLLQSVYCNPQWHAKY